MRNWLSLVLATASVLGRTALASPFPNKIYGVNLGSWLVLEPWMLPQGSQFLSVLQRSLF